MAQEGKELAKASFGTTILLAIGKAYEGQASIYLGGFFQGGLLSLRQDTQSLKSKASILNSVQTMYNLEDLVSISGRITSCCVSVDDEFGHNLFTNVTQMSPEVAISMRAHVM